MIEKLSDRELLALCTVIHSHNHTKLQEAYRVQCVNALCAPYAMDLRLAGNPPHREFN